MSAVFITFEGIDGCGKSTQVELLRQRLVGAGRSVVVVREPGGTTLSESIRHLLLDSTHRAMDPMSEALLLSASRSQLTSQVIVPALRDAQYVLADRYADSTLAYQGYGRGLPLESLRTLNRLSTGELTPFASVLVDIPVVEALVRRKAKTPDRIESEGSEFLERVRRGYLNLAEEESGRYIVVDGLHPVQQIEADVWNLLSRRIGL